MSVYSLALYKIVDFRGVTHVYLPVVWKLKVPPKLNVFLWLFSQNKIMTRDDLRKRHLKKPLECVFCKEPESVHHLFFECVVAKVFWNKFTNLFGITISQYT